MDMRPRLFGGSERTDTRAQQDTEGLYAFFDRSARPAFALYRSIVQGWLDEVSPDAAADD